MLKIYNTLGRELQEFKSEKEGKAMIYHCGPTVYWTQHIGNMRGMVIGDLIRRSMIYLGYSVDFSRNYTDVGHLTDDGDTGEDKMEKGAKREGVNPQEIADKYINQFENDTQALNILEPDHKPRATDFVQQMIKLTESLLEKDFAYATPSAIYFDITKAKDYTKLSGQKLEFQETGAGHGSAVDSGKRNPADFSLWFFKTGKHVNAIQTWPSPFSSPEVQGGEGFPGWHIECSAMAKATLADTIDLHLGGIEHIPVHHTNEIAQSESANGAKFANYWLHNEHLTVDGVKMSKSDGNGYVLKDILNKGYDPLTLRYFFLQAHYRSKQNFTWEALDAAATAYKRLVEKLVAQDLGNGKDEVDSEYKGRFISGLEDDFNIPQSLATAWEMLKDKNITDQVKLATALDFDRVLGLLLDEKIAEVDTSQEAPEGAKSLIEQRKEARDNKEWEKSDQLRDQLLLDYSIEVRDTEDGQTWKVL